MNDLDLPTYTVLHGFKKEGNLPLFPVKMKFYQCPECGEGPVTHHGGGLYICSECRWQR